MANEPQITYPQNPLTSKTVLVNIVGGLLTWATVHYGLSSILTPELQNEIATAVAMSVMAVANVLVRKYLSGAGLSFDAPLGGTPSQPLPSNQAVVVSTSPAQSAVPAEVTPIDVGAQIVSVECPPFKVGPDVPPPTVMVVPTPEIGSASVQRG